MKNYKVEILKPVVKELKRIDNQFIKPILGKINVLATDPLPLGSTKLVGSEYYRVRVGDYRVIYSVDEEQQLIVITRIRHRSKAY